MKRLALSPWLAAALTCAASPAFAAVAATVSSPAAGSRVTGDAVTVAAGLAPSDLPSVKRVRFQYRPAAGGAWIDLAGPSARPNPAATAPFYAHWDTTGLGAGAYELRAVAADAGGEDPSPASISVTVDPIAHAIDERLSGGAVRRDQSVGNGSAAVVDNGDSRRAQLARLQVPAGAIDLAATTLTLLSNPSTPAALPAGLALVGSLEISTLDGQTCFCNGRSAGLTLSYPDAEGDGLVDGTSAMPSALKIYYWDAAAASWKPMTTALDTSARTASAAITQLGVYALVAPSGGSGTLGRVYPVPFKPNGGDPDQGRAYSPSDPFSGIVFDDLPDGCRIEIYGDTGARVKRLDAGASRRIQWDVKNDRGQDVASGLYIAVLTAPGQAPWRRKLLVVR